MSRSRWVSPLFVVVLSVCCAPRAGPDLRPDPQFIAEEEVAASLAMTAYELIRTLRPNFLTYRGETSFDKRTSRPYPNVYVDDQAFGNISVLTIIPASDVESVRLYRSWDAMTKFGNGNPGGVIAISTRH